MLSPISRLGTTSMPDRWKRWEHGTSSGYHNHGCRCVPCKTAGRARAQARREAVMSGTWRKREDPTPYRDVYGTLPDPRVRGL